MEKEAKQSLNNKDISEDCIMSVGLEKREFSLSLFLEVEMKMNQRRMKMRFFFCGRKRFLCYPNLS